MLREVAQRRWGDGQLVVALLLIWQRTENVAAELGDPMHLARGRRRLRVGANAIDIDAELTPDFKRACVDHVRCGGSLWPITTFDNPNRMTHSSEQHRGAQANRAGTNDECVERGVAHQNNPWYEPPSRCKLWPEMKPAWALHRYAHASPTSSGRPSRFAAID